jgi:hypothetical protein
MNHRKKPPSKLLSLIDNSLVQFLVSLFFIAFLTQAANNFEDIYLQLCLKTLGYGTFFYLGTPFTLHWLAYVSSVKLTRLKITITILLVGVYSYIFWDSYFFYQQIWQELFFSATLA